MKVDEFQVFEAMDRVHTIIKMQSCLLGDTGELWTDGNIYESEDCKPHPALVKHSKLLLTIQENLAELYQLLGQDLDSILTEKGE